MNFIKKIFSRYWDRNDKSITYHIDTCPLKPSEQNTVSYQKPEFCCPRFEKAVVNREIHFSYDNSNGIDETAWFINTLWHIYYCPFCGTFIKGEGFGDYDLILKCNK